MTIGTLPTQDFGIYISPPVPEKFTDALRWMADLQDYMDAHPDDGAPEGFTAAGRFVSCDDYGDEQGNDYGDAFSINFSPRSPWGFKLAQATRPGDRIIRLPTTLRIPESLPVSVAGFGCAGFTKTAGPDDRTMRINKDSEICCMYFTPDCSLVDILVKLYELQLSVFCEKEVYIKYYGTHSVNVSPGTLLLLAKNVQSTCLAAWATVPVPLPAK